MSDHQTRLRSILVTLDAPPSEVLFHYVRATLEECDGCISEAARRLGMHRRTLQRMLLKKAPKPKATPGSGAQ
ncbi:MAG TPA: helix-turn-helix domain-containing protein [Devosia sp.]|jgi:ActR/RegA family two-component response regulator|nr:helix-turn-helix domain-containing protein [Devosia sp.]